jgi:hypothetical protein
MVYSSAASVPLGRRHNHHIDRRQARNFMEAIRYADRHLVELGRPLNTFATMNFDHIDCPSERVSAKFEQLRDNHFVRWLRYKAAAPPYYVWVLENQAGNTHVHWIVHIPKSLRTAFGRKLPEWLARIAGTVRCGESAINVKSVYDLGGLGRYLLKGMDPSYAARNRIRHEPQGLIYGKRCGVSKSLGPAARMRSKVATRSAD